uniref:Uncharacterized protein n=1 Tax=Rhizochromulina marina TaxID=1034831 RepID=A0A7S2WQR2_9STRA|mmetsp:Transcript_31219/g.90729  ORF Transcript_31219/g.90729 Transcript_31219/m.90729 type:complete len:301 (+) Transcript_31219:244-1146(+)
MQDHALPSRHRMPYPLAAWPFGEPRPTGQHPAALGASLADTPHLTDPAAVVRSDPSDLPIGAQRRRVTFPGAPREVQDVHHQPVGAPGDGGRASVAKEGERFRGAKHRRNPQSVVKLLLEELEDRIPTLGKLRNIGVEIRPSFPPPTLFGFVWCITIYVTALLLRRVIVALNPNDYTTRHLIQNPMLLKYLGDSWSWVLLLLAGVSIGATVRKMHDQFNSSFPVAATSRLLWFGTVAVLTLTGRGMEFAFGAWVGTYVQVLIGISVRRPDTGALNAKQDSTSRAKQLQPGGSPWAYRRWD